MARYVLVEFEDNAKAQAFVAKVNGDYIAVEHGQGVREGIRVRAVWAVPRKFCECSGKQKEFGWRRGEKTGWYIHADCGRPSKPWARGNHWFSAIGRNLLPKNKDWVPKGWGYL